MAHPGRLGGVVGVLATLALVACALGTREAPASRGASPQGGEATERAGGNRLAALVEAARREGRLTLVWSETALGGHRAAEQLGVGFNRYYGLDLQIQFTPGPSMPEMATRLTQEYQAGRRASSDILVGTELHIASAMDALEPVDWLEWAPNIQLPELVAPLGVAVQIASTTPNITYHSGRVTGASIPQSLQDLLKPQYKGRVASTPYAALFDQLASNELWGEQRTLDYVTKLADQVSGLMRVGELERLLSGEFDLFAINSNDYEPRKLKAQGAPIDYVIPADAPLILYRYMGVPRHAEHPNAAKLWINYILSREAQNILYQAAFTDHHRLPGSRTADVIEKLQTTGVKFYDIDVGFVQRNDPKELQRISAELQRILQKK
jgi:ABC-type Fe3+ transport system substrate-binding protein